MIHMNPSDYSRFRDQVHEWDSVHEYVTAERWPDGIHRITTVEGHWIELLIRGGVVPEAGLVRLPVFFNGAVDRSLSHPPFFSGSSIAVEAGAPVVAIADPTLNLRDDLGIGWYLGAPKSGTGDALNSILREIRRRAGAPLLFVGGSAGGFAALRQAAKLGEDAFVWNPQTDWLRYSAAATRPLLDVLLPDGGWAAPPGVTGRAVPPIAHRAASVSLRRIGIEHSVGVSDAKSKVLYLQNESDHHVPTHTKPYIEACGLEALEQGIYGQADIVIAMGQYNTGHRAPPREVIAKGLAMMLSGAPVRDVGRALRGRFGVAAT